MGHVCLRGSLKSGVIKIDLLDEITLWAQTDQGPNDRGKKYGDEDEAAPAG